VEEYISNAPLIEAQQKAKSAKARGEAPLSLLDEFMMNAEDLKPDKGYRMKTPGGHVVNYYENEHGEPFLLDDAGNLWIWAGADIYNPSDDWIVRTPDHDIFNYYTDDHGQIKRKRLGRDEDLKVLPKTNLGTIVGFVSDGINDLRYRELPFDSLEMYQDPNTGEELLLPPPILEEGFIQMQNKTSHIGMLPFIKNNTFVDHKDIKNTMSGRKEALQLNLKGFPDIVNIDEGEMIDTLENEGRVSSREARKLKARLLSRIHEEVETSLEGINVSDLPSAAEYADAGEELARQGGNPHTFAYLPGDLSNN
jgi:hypothetical protein